MSQPHDPSNAADPDNPERASQSHYCRELESYLCRKNDGHLIRISGPAFDRVSSWARQGIPLTVACQGIDRYFERYYRRGPRRRPVRIEFCEADVLDAFDAWRRAVGVFVDSEMQARSRPSLASHIERVIARLTVLRASAAAARRFEDVLERVARELDSLQPRVQRLRGHAREEVCARLDSLDREMMDAVMHGLDEETRSAARREADEQLAPFRDRMAPDAIERARAAAVEQRVREAFGLPTVAFG